MTKKQNAATEKLQDGKSTSTKEKTTEKQTTLLKLESKKPVEKKASTLEDLKKENAELKKKLSSMPTDLEDKISFYQHKQELIKKLNKMSANVEILGKHQESLKELIEEDDFSNEDYFLKITNKQGYSSEKDVLTISNPEVIYDLIDFVLKNLDAKKKKLQAEINA